MMDAVGRRSVQRHAVWRGRDEALDDERPNAPRGDPAEPAERPRGGNELPRQAAGAAPPAREAPRGVGVASDEVHLTDPLMARHVPAQTGEIVEEGPPLRGHDQRTPAGRGPDG